MNKKIKEKLKTLTTKPGVYVMHDAEGVVIYVGKAKNLKNRVSQYFRSSPKPSKVQAMVDNIDDFEYFITASEMDALALESNLIKKYQPFYNILLKDEKSSWIELTDFGNSFYANDSNNLPTPYLASRFYRAPEIILGLKYGGLESLDVIDRLSDRRLVGWMHALRAFHGKSHVSGHNKQ